MNLWFVTFYFVTSKSNLSPVSDIVENLYLVLTIRRFDRLTGLTKCSQHPVPTHPSPQRSTVIRWRDGWVGTECYKRRPIGYAPHTRVESNTNNISSAWLRGLDSSVLRWSISSNGCRLQTTRYHRSVMMMISNDRRMPSSADLRGKTESTARGEQPVGGNSNR